LILVGPGGDRENLACLADRLGISNHVQFVGAVPDPADYLRAADLFVLPSIAEGMSNSLLEAMATGLPCIVSGIGGNSDLITDRRTGRLVPATNPGTWAAAIVDLLLDPARGCELGSAARRLVDERFALRVVVDRYVNLYHDMVAGCWPAAG
jgi:glycosyltransferase involved in cell wall biosynthesis